MLCIVRWLMWFILGRSPFPRLTGKPNTTMSSSATSKYFKLLLIRLASNGVLRWKNLQKLNIKITLNSFNGLKDTTISTVDRRATFTIQKREETPVLILVLLKKTLFQKRLMEVVRWWRKKKDFLKRRISLNLKLQGVLKVSRRWYLHWKPLPKKQQI